MDDKKTLIRKILDFLLAILAAVVAWLKKSDDNAQ